MFSGIMAPETAMPWVGWKWCAEIEPFPCSVIAAHHPEIPNLGDVNAEDFGDRAKRFGAIDLLVAGAPCQDFSVAGRRAGMGGSRGSLSLRFIELVGELRPRWLLFENVPGMLSSAPHIAPDPSPPPDDLQPGQQWEVNDDYEADEGSDFGFFLAALSDIGYTSFAWTCVDAQYFGLAQRRDRLFVVASLGDWRGPAAVLFDRESLSGNPAPSREARQEVTGTLGARTTAGGGFGGDFETGGGLQPCQRSLPADGESADRERAGDRIQSSLAMCLNAGGQRRIDAESETFVATVAPSLDASYERLQGQDDQHINAGAGWFVAHSLRANGFDASEDGTGRGTPLVPVIAPCLTQNYGKQPDSSDTSAGPMLVAETLRSHPRPGSATTGPIIPILEAGARTGASTNDPRAGSGIGEPGDPMCTLQSGKQHAIGFYGNDSGNDAGDEVSPTLRAMPGGGGNHPSVCFDTTQITSKANRSNPKEGDPCHPLQSGAHAPAIAFTERGRDQGRTFESQEELAYALCNPGSGGRTHSRQLFTPQMAVRRLTPMECERLQGFPDRYTQVPHRGKEAADGPRYKALGNSMAVPVLKWLGDRIRLIDSLR